MSRREPRRPTPRKPRPAELAAEPSTGGTRERLVYAARKLLEDGGYGAASVQAIAERTGVATGALYRHFPSKAQLFVEVFRDAAKRDLTAMPDAASSGRCIQRLEAAGWSLCR